MERPDDILTDEEIEEAATAQPYKQPGSRSAPVSPWFAWAPSVLGKTILYERERLAEVRASTIDIDALTYAICLVDHREDVSCRDRAEEIMLAAREKLA